MLYELRSYHCVTGRLPALLNRFETVTLKLWEKHGIRQAGFWTVAIGESNQDLYYMLEWESLAERERKWERFRGQGVAAAALLRIDLERDRVSRFSASLARFERRGARISGDLRG